MCDAWVSVCIYVCLAECLAECVFISTTACVSELVIEFPTGGGGRGLVTWNRCVKSESVRDMCDM